MYLGSYYQKLGTYLSISENQYACATNSVKVEYLSHHQQDSLPSIWSRSQKTTRKSTQGPLIYRFIMLC